jgi:protein-disulfide isomerase
MQTNPFPKETTLFFKKNISYIALVLSILALGLSAYNTYYLKSRVVSGNATTTKNVKKLTTSEINNLIKNGAPVLGNPEAKVTVVEFADFQCPYCGKYFEQVLPEIKKYIDSGKVKFVYVSFAFLGDESFLAAEASKCAQDQNKFWEYHDYLYSNQQGENQGAFDVVNLKKFASKLGLNTSEFNQCLDSRKYKKVIEDDVALGNKFGVTGTPGTFINDFFIKGLEGVSYFKNRIDTALNN